MYKILLINLLVATLVLTKISGMDDEICKVLDLDDCTAQSIQKLCPEMCSRSIDDAFCKVLDLDDCKAQSIQKLCPQMCSRSTDDAFCKELDLDNCEEPVIKKRCFQRCSTAVIKSTARLPSPRANPLIAVNGNTTRLPSPRANPLIEIPFKNAYPGKFWPSTVCPPIEFEGYISFEVESLDRCFKACRKHVECTAVGYHKIYPSKCNLLKCPLPPPEPSGTDERWDTYYMGNLWCGDPECHPELFDAGKGRPFCAPAHFACPHGELACKCDQGKCCSPVDKTYANYCGDPECFPGKGNFGRTYCATKNFDCPNGVNLECRCDSGKHCCVPDIHDGRDVYNFLGPYTGRIYDFMIGPYTFCGPFRMHFKEEQCAAVRTIHTPQRVKLCEEACMRHPKCSAFDWSVRWGCVLRDCGKKLPPIPDNYENLEDWFSFTQRKPKKTKTCKPTDGFPLYGRY